LFRQNVGLKDFFHANKFMVNTAFIIRCRSGC